MVNRCSRKESVEKRRTTWLCAAFGVGQLRSMKRVGVSLKPGIMGFTKESILPLL
jgi:hypothetical protein